MCVCVEEVTSGMKGKFGSVRKFFKKNVEREKKNSVESGGKHKEESRMNRLKFNFIKSSGGLLII